eukprot:bmy_05889T0
MLKTTFQGFPGQQPAPGALDFPGSLQKLPFASEAESEASMSEASSEDLVPPLEAEEAPDRDEEEAAKKKKKKKKSKGLANMFSRPAAVAEGRTEAERAFLHMGRTMKEDLEAVVERLKPLFPAEFAVVAAYAQSYHEHFAAHLADLAQFELSERDTYVLLLWVQNLYPKMFVDQKWQIPQDLPSHLLSPLNELKSHGVDALLQNLFGVLKPLFKRFTQTRWAAPAQTLEEIISVVGERLPEFSELQDCFREELMELVHLHLVKEYIARLSKRRLVLNTAEKQQQLAGHVLANAELIQRFCTQNGSPATWLHRALPTLAEIIRLQDPSAIKIEVATYATWYPDFSKGHLSAILAIKGNLSSSEVRSIRSILDINTGAHEPSKALFSLIKVG